MLGRNFALVACALALVFTLSTANADEAALNAMKSYLSKATPAGAGMCDGMRSTIAQYKGPGFTLEEFIPADNETLRFYTVVKEDETTEYYSGQLPPYDAQTYPEVERLEPMDFWAAVAAHSINYATRSFFPDQPNDCATAALNK